MRLPVQPDHIPHAPIRRTEGLGSSPAAHPGATFHFGIAQFSTRHAQKGKAASDLTLTQESMN